LIRFPSQNLCNLVTSPRRAAFSPTLAPTSWSINPFLINRERTADNPNLAPPGWYMLYICDTNGVPSNAEWVHLGPPTASDHHEPDDHEPDHPGHDHQPGEHHSHVPGFPIPGFDPPPKP
jgi:hypothetical protein